MNFINCVYDASTRSVRIPINSEDLIYHLPEDIKQSLVNLADGTELVLGVRPEDVNIFTEPVSEGIEFEYILLEALGSENIHHLGYSELFLIARTSPADIYQEAQTLWVLFEHDGIRIFDRKSGEAI